MFGARIALLPTNSRPNATEQCAWSCPHPFTICPSLCTPLCFCPPQLRPRFGLTCPPSSGVLRTIGCSRMPRSSSAALDSTCARVHVQARKVHRARNERSQTGTGGVGLACPKPHPTYTDRGISVRAYARTCAAVRTHTDAHAHRQSGITQRWQARKNAAIRSTSNLT